MTVPRETAVAYRSKVEKRMSDFADSISATTDWRTFISSATAVCVSPLVFRIATSSAMIRCRRTSASRSDGYSGFSAVRRAMERSRSSTATTIGQPTLRGMRITVKDVLGFLAAGMTPDEILSEYPYLERDDIRAALEYAAETVPDTVPA